MSADEMSPLLLAGVIRVHEHEHTGPVYDNGDWFASVAAFRAQCAADDSPVPPELWANADHTRVVVLEVTR